MNKIRNFLFYSYYDKDVNKIESIYFNFLVDKIIAGYPGGKRFIDIILLKYN
jgi:hypothetical protein